MKSRLFTCFGKLNKGLKVTLMIMAAQIIVTMVAVCLIYFFYSGQYAKSALLGGAICLSTTALFGLRLFVGRAVISAEQVISRFYSGLVQKFVLTVFLFVIAILWLDVEFAALIIVYAISLSTFWFALLVKT